MSSLWKIFSRKWKRKVSKHFIAPVVPSSQQFSLGEILKNVRYMKRTSTPNPLLPDSGPKMLQQKQHTTHVKVCYFCILNINSVAVDTRVLCFPTNFVHLATNLELIALCTSIRYLLYFRIQDLALGFRQYSNWVF